MFCILPLFKKQVVEKITFEVNFVRLLLSISPLQQINFQQNLNCYAFQCLLQNSNRLLQNSTNVCRLRDIAIKRRFLRKLCSQSKNRNLIYDIC